MTSIHITVSHSHLITPMLKRTTMQMKKKNKTQTNQEIIIIKKTALHYEEYHMKYRADMGYKINTLTQ